MVDCVPSRELEMVSNCLRLSGESMSSSAVSLNFSGEGKRQQRGETSGFRAGFQSKTR